MTKDSEFVKVTKGKTTSICTGTYQKKKLWTGFFVIKCSKFLFLPVMH